jgi:hypothetical protein
MARRVFFSFHFQRDLSRVNVVRNSGAFRPAGEIIPFYDGSIWEDAKTKGDAAIKRLIDRSLKGASVTCVLIGAETSQRRYVGYEIQQSYGSKGLLGVYVHGIKDFYGQISPRGANPFENWNVSGTSLATLVPTYDWVANDGYRNFASWIEAAAKAAGR